MRRKPITKKIRFEVYKRDGFTCQYCGKSAPDVVLHVDHIEPVSKGGGNDFINLVTSCLDCNLGKGARRISDTSVVQKQKKQIKELQSKTEQLEMMVAWHKGLCGIKEKTEKAVADYWAESVTGYSLNAQGIKKLASMCKKFTAKELLEAIDIAVEKLTYDDEGEELNKESAEKAWSLVPRICEVNRRTQEKPYLKDIYYIRGILKNRIYVNLWESMKLLEQAAESGVEIGAMKDLAVSCRNWSCWKSDMEDLIEEAAA